jgi:hypothetical protein
MDPSAGGPGGLRWKLAQALAADDPVAVDLAIKAAINDSDTWFASLQSERSLPCEDEKRRLLLSLKEPSRVGSIDYTIAETLIDYPWNPPENAPFLYMRNVSLAVGAAYACINVVQELLKDPRVSLSVSQIENEQYAIGKEGCWCSRHCSVVA